MVDEPVGGRLDEGLQAVFRSVFPISDFSARRFGIRSLRIRAAENTTSTSAASAA